MFYDFLISCILLAALPKIVKKPAKRRHHFTRFFLPKKKLPKKAIWVHGVSLGEINAAKPLLEAIRKKNPNVPIIVSSSTDTGTAAAKKLAHITESFTMPFDFSFLMRPLVKKLQPKAFFLMEGDYWKNCIRYTKDAGAKVFLVSGQMSRTSAKYFTTFPFWTKRIFSLFNALLVQNDLHYKRFSQAGARKEHLHITGNIKYAASFSIISAEEKKHWRKRFFLEEEDLVMTIASTHDPEESMFLEKCSLLWQRFPNLKVFLVPRHPERFREVETMLLQKGISFIQYTKLSKGKKAPLILIDTMGFLPTCYALSDAAVVAGSYTSKVGGHNILEANFLETPVFYGPYMEKQKDLEKMIREAGSGRMLSLDNWITFFTKYFQDPSEKVLMQNAARTLTRSLKKSLEKTTNCLETYEAFL